MPNIKTNKVHVFGWGKQVKIPKFIKAVQHYKEVPHVSDPRAEIKFKLAQFGLKDKIKPGMRIAVTAGSRGVDGMVDVIAQIIQEIKDCGGEPFVFPSMGSHGGATAEGQREVLASYGVTEERMGVPIDASMDTIFLGETETLHIPVYFSRAAYEADWVLPVNRVKAHTDFYGPIESGLNKMITIGLGKETGCTALHRCGTTRFAQIIPEASKKVLSTGKVRFGLAIVENGYDHTALIRAVPDVGFHTEET